MSRQPMSGITLSFSGVNQIYQLALAAQEIGQLDVFHCSLLDAPGKWGSLLSRVLGADTLINRGAGALDARWVREWPWPFLFQRVAEVTGQAEGTFHWTQANFRFDAHVAKQLVESPSRLFVGVETCARDSLRVARRRGMKTVLDCPQSHPAFLEDLLRRGAEDVGFTTPHRIDTPEMAARKAEEFDAADLLIVPSEVCRRSFLEAGFKPERLMEIPLWADPTLWYAPPEVAPELETPLCVLFVGSVNLRKGIPYLLRAARQCGQKIRLTLVGAKALEMAPLLKKYARDFEYMASQTKSRLREMYWRSDVLVLPSLMDTFGFVAMEAMACGLPVIVTENCGVPVPDPSWRVPIMDADALTERLLSYAGDRELCRAHGKIAAEFARQYRPETYRRQVSDLFRNLLSGESPVLYPVA